MRTPQLKPPWISPIWSNDTYKAGFSGRTLKGHGVILYPYFQLLGNVFQFFPHKFSFSHLSPHLQEVDKGGKLSILALRGKRRPTVIKRSYAQPWCELQTKLDLGQNGGASRGHPPQRRGTCRILGSLDLCIAANGGSAKTFHLLTDGRWKDSHLLTPSPAPLPHKQTARSSLGPQKVVEEVSWQSAPPSQVRPWQGPARTHSWVTFFMFFCFCLVFY